MSPPDAVFQQVYAPTQAKLVLYGDTSAGKSVQISAVRSAPQLLGNGPVPAHREALKRQLDCFKEANKTRAVSPREVVLLAPAQYNDPAVIQQVQQRVGSLSTCYKTTRSQQSSEVIMALFSNTGNSGEVNSETHILRLPSSTGRYQLLISLSDSAAIMDDFRSYAGLWHRYQQQEEESDYDDSDDESLGTGKAAARVSSSALSPNEEDTMHRLKAKLSMLIAPSAALDQLTAEYRELNPRTKAFNTFELPWMSGLREWFSSTIMAHGATDNINSSVAFIHDLLMVLTTTDALQPLFLGDNGLMVLLKELDRQQGGWGLWEELQQRPELRKAVAGVIAGGTAVLFEPEKCEKELLLPSLKLLPVLDTIGTGDPNSIHEAQTQQVLTREQHGICLRKDNLVNATVLSSPMFKRVVRSAVLQKRGSPLPVASSVAILVTHDAVGYTREMAELGLGKHVTLEDLQRTEVCEKLIAANIAGEQLCQQRIRELLTKQKVDRQPLSKEEQDAVLAEIPVVKGLPCLGQALLTQLPAWARDNPAQAAHALTATNYMRFRWLHWRPLGSEARAALTSRIADLREQLHVSQAGEVAEELQSRLLVGPISKWLEPFAAKQPLGRLAAGGLLQIHGVAYGKQVQKLIRAFIQGRYAPLFRMVLQPAFEAAAGKLVATVTELLIDAGVQSAHQRAELFKQALLPTNKLQMCCADHGVLDVGEEYLDLVCTALETADHQNGSGSSSWLQQLHASLLDLPSQLVQLLQEAVLGLQLAYADRLGMLDTRDNPAAAAALAELLHLAPATPAAAAGISTPPPAGTALAVKAETDKQQSGYGQSPDEVVLPAAAAGSPDAAARGVSGCKVAAWSPWPPLGVTAETQLVQAVKDFCNTVNNYSDHDNRAKRAAAAALFQTTSLMASTQQARLSRRVIRTWLQETWPAAVSKAQLLGYVSDHTAQQQLVKAVSAVGNELLLNTRDWMHALEQQLLTWALSVFPAELDPSDIARTRGDGFCSKMEDDAGTETPNGSQQQKQQQQQQDERPAKNFRTTLIGSTTSALGTVGRALLGLPITSVSQQHSKAWKKGELQRQLQQAEQRLMEVEQLLDPELGPEFHKLPRPVAAVFAPDATTSGVTKVGPPPQEAAADDDGEVIICDGIGPSADGEGLLSAGGGGAAAAAAGASGDDHLLRAPVATAPATAYGGGQQEHHTPHQQHRRGTKRDYVCI